MRLAIIGIACGALLLPGPVAASSITYADRASFEAALSTSITDPYSPLVYGAAGGTFDDATMSALFGETDYSATAFTNLNFVVTVAAGDLAYCSGCNGSFELGFTTTSIGTPDGVYGVGFNFWNELDFDRPRHAFVTFGDGSTQDFELPLFPIPDSTLVGFFGITSETLIRSIHIGLADGEIATGGSSGIDNLTIGRASTSVPEPASLLLLGAGGLGLIAKARRRKKLTS